MPIKKRLGLGKFWTICIPVDGQRLQPGVIIASRLPIARGFRGAGSAENTPETVGITLQRALELCERLRRRVKRHEHLAKQLAGRRDVSRRDRRSEEHTSELQSLRH